MGEKEDQPTPAEKKNVEDKYFSEIRQRVNGWSESMKYQMLDRMRGDVDYWVNTGKTEGGHKHLWAGNPKEQADYMETIYNSLKEKPEWFSQKDLENYKNELTGSAE